MEEYYDRIWVDNKDCQHDITDAHLSNEIIFHSGDFILKLTKDGFVYKGDIIEDAGEAHNLFMEWLTRQGVE